MKKPTHSNEANKQTNEQALWNTKYEATLFKHQKIPTGLPSSDPLYAIGVSVYGFKPPSDGTMMRHMMILKNNNSKNNDPNLEATS